MFTMFTIELFFLELLADIRNFSKEKLQEYTEKANAGNGQAQYELSVYATIMKNEGMNIENLDSADLMRKAIGNNYPIAYLALGYSFAKHNEVDEADAAFQLACEFGCDIAIEGQALQSYNNYYSSNKLSDLELALKQFELGAQKGLFGSMVLYGWLQTFTDIPKQIQTGEKRKKAAIFADLASTKLTNFFSKHHYSLKAFQLISECYFCLGHTYEYLAQNQGLFQKGKRHEYYSKAYDAYKQGSYLNAAHLVLEGKVGATKIDALVLIRQASMFRQPWIPEEIMSKLKTLIKTDLEYLESKEELLSYVISETLNIAIGDAFDKINLSNRLVDSISRELTSQVDEQIANLTACQILKFAMKWRLF